jgi:hypothetical protein
MTVYFCDHLNDVSILNGVARLEFQRFEAQPAGEGRELRAVAAFTVVIPIHGLAQAINVLDGVRDRLVREGIFKTGGDGPAPPPGDRSPNF